MISDQCPITRRHLLQLGVAGAASLSLPPLWGRDDPAKEALADAIAKLEYLTPADKFGTVERGNPLPSTLPPDKLREVGLDRDTWRLEVVTDPESDSKIEQPLSKEASTALDWAGLMELADKHAVRYMKVMTCNNIGEPLGVGLWEGVPLREAIWLTRPVENIRRVFYYGYHNDDPKQLFQSSLAIGRVLEDPPGELPVMLCYKLNGQWLSGKRGGPVRMLVPEAYGFKSVKWLQRVVLTNNHQANDTYAGGNNDIESPMKTFARFINAPQKSKAGDRIPLIGMAQVGVSGLSKVQIWLHPHDAEWPADDPYFAAAPWNDAETLRPPSKWGDDLPDGQLPETPHQFDPSTGKPRRWPMRYAIAHWATLLDGVAAGKYLLSCRTIDANGNAQPMPRPFAKSGRNAIQRVGLLIES
jgi:DMSO/TMAO reductase YedYZ molybdopterin-dependent catalytic subunit